MAIHPHAPLFRVERSHHGSETILTPIGDLDLATVDVLRSALLRAELEDPGEIVLDLGRLEFVAVAGVRLILELYRRLPERLTLRSGARNVQRIFQLTGVEDLLPWGPRCQVMQFPSAAERNLKFVRRLWRVYEHEGVEAFGALVPSGVQWRPWGVASRFTSVGENVHVRSDSPLGDGLVKPLWSLHEFAQSSLVRAASFERESDALGSGA